MRKLLSVEELAQFVICIYSLSKLDISYNYFILVPAFFVPDLFAIGYLISKPVGAFMYNFSHHKLIAILITFAGILAANQLILACGLIAYAHTTFDRTIGYGLKYTDSPSHTHLGFIGKEKHKNESDHF